MPKNLLSELRFFSVEKCTWDIGKRLKVSIAVGKVLSFLRRQCKTGLTQILSATYSCNNLVKCILKAKSLYKNCWHWTETFLIHNIIWNDEITFLHSTGSTIFDFYPLLKTVLEWVFPSPIVKSPLCDSQVQLNPRSLNPAINRRLLNSLLPTSTMQLNTG